MASTWPLENFGTHQQQPDSGSNSLELSIDCEGKTEMADQEEEEGHQNDQNDESESILDKHKNVAAGKQRQAPGARAKVKLVLQIVPCVVSVAIFAAVLYIAVQAGAVGSQRTVFPSPVTESEGNRRSELWDSVKRLANQTARIQMDRQIDLIQVAINMTAVPNCTLQYRSKMEPCKNRSVYISDESQVVQPLHCVDDAHRENRAANPDSCLTPSRSFKLHPIRGQVEILRPGTYQLIAMVTTRMLYSCQVHFGLTVNSDHLSFLCTVQSYGSGPDRAQSVPYSHCSVQGLRRLRTGDRVAMFLAEGGVALQSLYRSTFMQVARMGD